MQKRDKILFFTPLFSLPLVAGLLVAVGVVDLEVWGRSIGLVLLALSFGLAGVFLRDRFRSQNAEGSSL